MALVIDDRVRETTTVTGTNDATLLGAVTGFQAFSVIGNGNTTYYTISDQSGGNWEVGIGTFSSVGPTLARTTVLSSSAGGAKVSFPAGTKDVFITYPSDKAVYLDGSDNVQPALGDVVASQVNITAQGDLRLEDTSGGQYVALQAPGTVATSYTLTLPVDDGTNGQALITDGNGVLSWSSAASGDVYGPASATDNGVALFDGTTGKIIKNSSSFVQTGTGVGIGTASPANRLDVQVSTNVRIARFKNTSSTVQDYSLFVANDSDVTFGLGVFGSTAGTVGMVGANAAFIDTSSTSLNIFASNASGVIKFATGGNTERMRIDSSGNVGIGTSSPTSIGTGITGLTINGTGGGAVIFKNSGTDTGYIYQTPTGIAIQNAQATPIILYTNNAERMRIDASGNVGIGVTSLAAFGTGRGVQIATSATSQASSLYLQNGTTGTTGSDGLLLQMGSDNTTGYLWNYENGILAFATNNTERMRITSAGNVGIGTSSPAVPLDIVADSTSVGVNIRGRSLDGIGSLRINSNNGSVNYAQFSGSSSTVQIRSISTQPILFDINSAERMRLDASGNLQLGTTTSGGKLTIKNPSSSGEQDIFVIQGATNTTSIAKLTFDQSVDQFKISANTTAGFLVFGTGSGGSERMRITSAGNVGIGTSSPAERLHISGAAAAIRIDTTTAYNASPTAAISFVGVYNAGGGLDSFAAIAAQKANTTDGDGSANLIFSTNTSTANRTEKMRITAAGNVGIGTSSPAFPLDINAAIGVMRINSSTGTNTAYLYTTNTGGDFYFGRDNSAGSAFGGSAYAAVLYSSGAYPMQFFTNATEQMRIDSSGNVGIGITNPETRLHVSGTGRFSGGTEIIQIFHNNTNGVIETAGNSTTPILFANGGVERMRIDSSGNLLVGCTSLPTGSISGFGFTSDQFYTSVTGTAANTQVRFYNGNGLVGNITTSGSATAFNTSSDYRLKENIEPMAGALDKVVQLKPCTYTWKVDGSGGQGFIAHELAEVIDGCVTGEKDAVDKDGKPVYQGIDTSFLVATLTAAIQEQQKMIENLTTRLNALEGK